jgi:hypothetical protein
MCNEVERLSRGRGHAPFDKLAKQRLLYLLLIYLYRIDEAVCFRETKEAIVDIQACLQAS